MRKEAIEAVIATTFIFTLASIGSAQPGQMGPTSQGTVAIRVSVRPDVKVTRQDDGQYTARVTNGPIKLSTRREGNLVIVVPE